MSQSCPRCGLVLYAQPGRVVMEHCPRCLGRARVVIGMVAVTGAEAGDRSTDSSGRQDSPAARAAAAAWAAPPVQGGPMTDQNGLNACRFDRVE